MMQRLVGWVAGLLGVVGLLAGEAGTGVPATRQGPEFDVPVFTGTIMPTPREVSYRDAFLSLARTVIVPGPEAGPEDPRVRLLVERIERYGGTVAIQAEPDPDADCILVVGRPPWARDFPRSELPAVAESFSVACPDQGAGNVVLLEGRDSLGLLWAVTAVNQLIGRKAGKPALRKADVRDYPDVPARQRGVGFGGVAMVGSKGDDHSTASAVNAAWFAVQFRFGVLFLDRVYMESSKQWWREGAVAGFKKGLDDMGRFLNPLGIEWYVRVHPVYGTPEQKIRSGSQEDFDSVFAIASAIAEAGGNLFLTYDDHRFPVNPADTKAFGTAREADVAFINRLYKALKAKHPSVKMCFCPPFYWGPLSSPAYPEPRDAYLSAIGERLPKEIGVIWTGPRVKSTTIETADLDWITSILKRKPTYWQNGVGIGYGGYWWHYGTEPIPAFRDWYGELFFEGLDGYMRYANLPSDCISLIAQADYLWNRKAYDPERSIRDAAGKVVGPEHVPMLAALTEALRVFDIYGMAVSPASVRDAPVIAGKRVALETAWANLMASPAAPAVRTWSKLESIVAIHRRFAQRVESTKELKGFEAAQLKIRQLAEQEAGYGEGAGFLLTPHDFLGGFPAKTYGHQCEPRLATWIYGARTRFGKMNATWPLPAPPEHDYELILSGQNHDAPDACRIRIRVNGHPVFEGPNPFVRGGWSRQTFPVEGQLLRDGRNTLTIENIEASDIVSGPPYFLLNYAVVRPKK